MLNDKSNREKIQIVYICYILGLLIFLPAIYGVILAYTVRKDVDVHDWLRSHCDWLIMTFGCSLLALFMAMIAPIGIVGSLVYIVCGVWTVYRIVRGWMKFANSAPVVPGRYNLI